MGELAGNTFGNYTVYRASGERGPQELAAFSADCALGELFGCVRRCPGLRSASRHLIDRDHSGLRDDAPVLAGLRTSGTLSATLLTHSVAPEQCHSRARSRIQAQGTPELLNRGLSRSFSRYRSPTRDNFEVNTNCKK